MKFTHFMADPSSASNIKPIPAKNLIPQWYRDAEKTYIYENKEAKE